MSQPDLFVVCKNCGSEVSPYVTECPYCGQRVRKRAPKLDRSGGEPEPEAAPAPREAAAAAGGGDRRHRARHPAVRDVRADPACVVVDPAVRARTHGRRPRLPDRRAGRRRGSGAGSSTPVPVQRPARLRVRGARGRRHLRDAAGAPLRPVRRSWPCSCCPAPPAWRWPSLIETPPLFTDARHLPRVRAPTARRSGCLRLARGRPPGGAPRRRPRERPDGRVRDRRGAGAAVARRGGGEHRRRPWAGRWPARCSG